MNVEVVEVQGWERSWRPSVGWGKRVRVVVLVLVVGCCVRVKVPCCHWRRVLGQVGVVAGFEWGGQCG